MANSFLSEHWRKLVIPFIIILVVCGYLFIPHKQNTTNFMSQQIPTQVQANISQQFESEQHTGKNEETDSNESLVESSIIIVDVRGAVQYPGVYTLKADDRVIDAIQAAGGYTENADSRLVNHALKLSDESFIYIPLEGETVPEDHMQIYQNNESNNSGLNQAQAKINLNTASENELTTLTGIGPSKAMAIIKYREEHGRFQSIEELMNVSGIGAKTFENLQDEITVN